MLPVVLSYKKQYVPGVHSFGYALWHQRLQEVSSPAGLSLCIIFKPRGWLSQE